MINSKANRIMVFIPVILFLLGMYFTVTNIFNRDLSMMPGDLGDTRFNNFILEHGFRYLTGQEKNYWDAGFMYPHKNVIAFSDNLLGTVPLYFAFRITGTDRETAFQLWLLALFALNYILCYIALRKWSGHVLLSAVGAYIYSFSIFNLTFLNHVQGFPRFLIPLIFYWSWQFLEKRKIEHFILVVTGVVYQFYCGIYLGVFTVSFLFFMTLSYSIMYLPHIHFNLRYSLKMIATVAGAIILMLPLYLHYVTASREVGFFRFDEIDHSIPTWRSYFFANSASSVWQILGTHAQTYFQAWWNQMLFPGAIPFLGILFSPLILFGKKIKTEYTTFILFLLTMCMFTTFFYIKVENFTLYELIYKLPGFGSIRSLDRVFLLQIMIIILIFVFALKFLSEKYKSVSYLLYLLPVLVVYENMFDPYGLHRYVKKDAQEMTANLKFLFQSKLTAGNTTVAYLPLKPDYPDQYKDQLTAMIVCQDLGKNCVNAYTGIMPVSYNNSFYSNMNQSSLTDWCKINNMDVNSVTSVTEDAELTEKH